ncbi:MULTISPECIES: hypothetical protein [Pseudoalteromonas]|uniref:hypothetical protein n=1 Tax=Pseudoalteromonas TaxID=53246 RepID=UPI0002CC2A8D|nr:MULTISPECIES: hypothetical protein [Pseudoalteromonas]ENN97519.1 hypothetical protein J139_17124 [Pseudoalteromonas agarivorans S816]TMS63816.1 hypothetical protein CWB86_20935 [Pseudoalteromonas sp. S1731]TMS64183.1 hypothetical protein CWB83_18390 [Pseudoalteromonas sp. S1691]TMS68215.1 hypothetical protein CWB88_19815 [Pseudoalteromonas sp. S1941]TMS68329.1 hypothetical protein CWB86_12710 [Pseudoalteromonas sp. S1731]
MATGKVKAGDVFNNWTVLNEDRRNRGVQHFMCKCVCGTTRVVRKDNLGLVQGCGCERKIYKARTGKTKPRTKKARIVSPKTVSAPAKIPHHENQEPRPQYQQRSKSTRELLEERLAQKQLEKELSELW